MGQVVPYLLNDRDTIELTPNFDQRLRAAALAEPGEQSALEQTFRALGLGRRVIDQLIENAISDMAGADPEATLALRLTDRDDAADWFTESVFGSLQSLVGFLLGETESFEIRVSFAGREQLAPVFTELLGRTSEELLREGYFVTDAELEDRLGTSFDSVIDDPRSNLRALRAGFNLSLDDVYGGDADGLKTREDADEIRKWIGRITTSVRWGLFGIVALLAVAIGFLGERRWPTRILWGASALFVSALIVVIGAGPLYDEVAAGEIRDELTEDSLDWPQALLAEQDRIADDVVELFDRALNGVVGEGLLLLVASALLVAVSALWARQREPKPMVDSSADPEPLNVDTDEDGSENENGDGGGSGADTDDGGGGGATRDAPWRR